MSDKLLLIGGGGHCISVIDSIERQKLYSEIGVVEKYLKEDTNLMGVPIIGCDEDLQRLYNEGYRHAFVSLGSIENVNPRIKLYKQLKSIGFHIPSIVDDTAIVSERARIGEGVYVGKGSIINAGAQIGICAIVNTGAIIEHECVIDDFCHIASGVVLGGRVVIGDSTHIGSNATIKQGIVIGQKSLIGSGSVVVRNINNNVLAFGNPCREVKSR